MMIFLPHLPQELATLPLKHVENGHVHHVPLPNLVGEDTTQDAKLRA
jgi:hypothetical protein